MHQFKKTGTLALLVLMAGAARFSLADSSPATRPADIVAEENNDFAVDLYGQLSIEPGNIFFSPYSISTAFAMANNGAEGNTAAQLEKVFHFTDVPTDTDLGFQALSDELDDAMARPVNGKRAFRLSVANSMWGQDGVSYKTAFTQALADDFGVEFHKVDFVSDAAAATVKIDAWVARRTDDIIQTLFPAGALDANTRLVLVNAIYFKGKWASPFDPVNTLDQSFHLDSANDVTAKMMQQEGLFPYMEDDSVQVIELPYARRLSMIVIVPRTVDGLADVEKDLTSAQISGWVGQLQLSDVRVALPRFTTRQSYSLAGTLAAMGMPQAFNKMTADFSGIADEQLYISQVQHKAFVAVDEAGTTAAAATGIGVGVDVVSPPPPEVDADHPFLFLIRDTRSGAILFMGREADPTTK